MSEESIQDYVDSLKDFYEIFIQYIDDQIDFDEIVLSIHSFKIFENAEIKLFFKFLIEISNNHHRDQLFIEKIHQILLYIACYTKKCISNLEMFELSKSNKLMLLFLISNQIIIVDEEIANRMIVMENKNHTEYCLFFYPEIKQFIDKEEQDFLEYKLSQYNLDNLDDLINKRQNGENDSYISSLIQNDFVEEFVSYYNRANFSLSSLIKQSIFETNPLLIKDSPSLIEYAAFFGSIQIFQFLKYNEVELTPSLWIYAIHSNNPELIHILEENNINPPDVDYVKCFIESIKCHHNNIGNYILENYLNSMNENQYSDIVIKSIFRFHNYSYFLYNLNTNNIFYYLSKYGYSYLLNLYLETKHDLINQNVISNEFFFKSCSKTNSFHNILNLFSWNSYFNKDFNEI